MQKFDTPAPVSVDLDLPAGRVQFIAADRADTTVEVLPANPSKSRDVKAAEQTEVAYGDGVLRIHAPAAKNQYFGASGAIEVTVQLPAGSQLAMKSSYAELRGVGRFGDVTFEGAQGGIKIDEAASVRSTTSGGDVSVGRLTGPAEISTAKGDLRISEAVRGEVVLNTQMGDVTVNAAAGVSASLDAGTGYGRIHNALKNTDGAAALNIHATTAYGNIAAHSL
ncbi:DUF4097 family beta strand repeat-containing protein [Streptomyces sp. 891-h]|uniref:DUF4097 family beta strand repeat-containing protein n=1 Tax=unclassified Streptomyces TaxID=2593676 RepID=UPI001FAAAF91|nr:DUF4097 family beta strand repeat-containing protein [Streptomyces sp. 891-h]UNZ19422.1 DUF4097 domain-containing protein [Streptomyces sp. 891-h]